MNLKVVERDDIPSMAVDNKGNLFYNSKWVDKLTDGQIKGVLIHEVLHIALEHLIRGMNKEHEIYNIAGDLVINNILVSNNFELPKGLIPYQNEFEFNPKLIITDLDKKSADEVYNELMANEQVKKAVGQKSGCGFDEHIYSKDGKGNTDKDGDLKQTKKKWNRLLSEASVYAKQQGKLPQGMDRHIDTLLNEKINWKSILYKYITRELPYDYTYNRPSKKSRATGIYLPSVLRESIDIVVSIDTSGSISQTELSEFLGEIIGIAKSFNNIAMKLIVCDSDIKEVYDIRNGSIATIQNLKIKGGGGTSHKPIYDYISENLPNTKFVINFTDGYTDFPDYESTRTIWVITSNGCEESYLPFGEYIKLDK